MASRMKTNMVHMANSANAQEIKGTRNARLNISRYSYLEGIVLEKEGVLESGAWCCTP